MGFNGIILKEMNMLNHSAKHYNEYTSIVGDILSSPEFNKLKAYRHHYGVSRFEHSVNVSYYSFLICKGLGLNFRAAARAGLLHDFFHYECHKEKTGMFKHAKLHPKLALKNAQQLTPLSELEKDIILKHMFLCSTVIPQYRESYIVSALDKLSAVCEAAFGVYTAIRTLKAFKLLYGKKL